MSFDERLVFRFVDGSIALVGPGAPELEGETSPEYWARIERAWRTHHPSYTGAEVVGIIPADVHRNMDRTFRGAWTWRTPEPVIDIDMEKARKIQEDRLAAQAASEEREAKIQAAREAIGPAIAAAQTPDELKAVKSR